MALSPTAITPVAAFTDDLYPPASGTTVQAADVEVLAQALGNRWAWLLAQPRIVEVFTLSMPDQSEAHAQIGSDITSNTFGDVDTATAFMVSTLPVKVGDVIVLHGQVHATRAALAGTPGAMRLKGPVVGATQTYCDDSIPQVPVNASGAGDHVVTFSGTYTVSGNASTIKFTLQARKGDTDIKIVKPCSLSATIFRTGL